MSGVRGLQGSHLSQSERVQGSQPDSAHAPLPWTIQARCGSGSRQVARYRNQNLLGSCRVRRHEGPHSAGPLTARETMTARRSRGLATPQSLLARRTPSLRAGRIGACLSAAYHSTIATYSRTHPQHLTAQPVAHQRRYSESERRVRATAAVPASPSAARLRTTHTGNRRTASFE